MSNNKTNIKNVYAISDIHGCYFAIYDFNVSLDAQWLSL